MSPSRRRMVVSILAAFVIAITELVGLILEWYLPMARHWWGLVLFVATYCLPPLAVYVLLRPVLRPFRERKARRTSRGIADHSAR